jgi:hypothetical protein
MYLNSCSCVLEAATILLYQSRCANCAMMHINQRAVVELAVGVDGARCCLA